MRVRLDLELSFLKEGNGACGCVCGCGAPASASSVCLWHCQESSSLKSSSARSISFHILTTGYPSAESQQVGCGSDER